MEYKFREIEKKWQQKWQDDKVYKVSNDSPKPKYYVLDMFPYPSGAGLHVGHPLGYIASDIYSRYKRLKGFNVLHPMGFDSFGLPAEQYAIETGQHPAETTKNNIATFKSQLDKIGFCYDWEREVQTSDPNYYKWTQKIFLDLFNSWYNGKTQKAESITQLIALFETDGATALGSQHTAFSFTANEWKAFTESEQADVLMNYRLAFSKFGEVNWCEALGTVLANDEVVNGVSERGGHPVIKKKMRQWYLRITAYADRLLQGLETVDFSDSMKEMQRNWIGRSEGAEIEFSLTPNPSPKGEGNKIPSNIDSPSYKTAIKEYWDVLKQYGRENRKNATLAEDMLWQRLRNNQLGEKVRRQHAVQGFIVDFAFLNSKLVVEIDGGYHNKAEQKVYDDARTSYLKEFDLSIIRFTNEEVENKPDKVVELIKVALDEYKQNQDASAPLSLGRGVGGEATLKVYTTRPDTIFGVDFMVVAPEHELIESITTAEQKDAVDAYINYVKSRSDRERQAEKNISGAFTGAYAINPFDGRQIPIWISEYVLAGYGTGAIMAVPCGDERDFKFAQHFNIPVTNIIGSYFNGNEANPTKEATLENSGFLTGLKMKDAIAIANDKIEEMGIGKRKVNYKMRDAGFSRQRYWGEPFPIVWENGIAKPLNENELPLELPYVEKYGPGAEGEGPLANIKDWVNLPNPSKGGALEQQNLEQPENSKGVAPLSFGEGLGVRSKRETSTMPGYAGSSWYFLRYMDPTNNKELVNKQVADYWNQVDLYVGGTEHAVGHLLYSRMWTKVLYDLGYIGFDEPFKKLLNQGMITGKSYFVDALYMIEEGTSNLRIFLRSFGKGEERQSFVFEGKSYAIHPLGLADFRLKNAHRFVDANDRITKSDFIKHIKDNGIFDEDEITRTLATIEWEQADNITSEEYLQCNCVIEKMSKSKFNVDNPNELCNQYGADTFRMYEMFLGPVEQSKPWDTKGIEGVHRFIKKLWRLFFDETKGAIWTSSAPSPLERAGGEATAAELKVLHKTIKKIDEDTERFSYNTAVSAFMVCVNELADLKCHKKEVLEQVLVLLTPYAPHIAEELWAAVGNTTSILDATYPVFNASFTTESSKEYPVSINGKMRTTLTFSVDAEEADVKPVVLQNEIVQKWLEGKEPKKIIFVKNKMINVVV